MTRTIYRKLAIFAVPAAILLAAGLVYSRVLLLPSPWRELVPHLPFLLIATGLLLSIHFHRGRVSCALLLLALFYASWRGWLQGGIAGFRERFIFAALALLIPVNLTILSFLRERGTLSAAGRLRLGFLLLQAGVVAWLVRYHYSGVAELIGRDLVSWPLLAGMTLPQPAFAAFIAGTLLSGGRMVARQSPIDSALLGALLAAGIACGSPFAPGLVPVFITAAALVLTLAVVQDSHNMAFRDELTGLPARRALNELLHGLGRQYVVAMLDVDHFKSFNDTYGHDVGDQVLRMVAAKMQRVGGGGRAFRFGGEEFTIVFPRRGLEEAVPHLEEVRRSIADYRLVLRGSDRPARPVEGKKQRGGGGGESVSVTISIGVAEGGGRQVSPAEVLKEADQALYRAKHKGRNQLSR